LAKLILLLTKFKTTRMQQILKLGGSDISSIRPFSMVMARYFFV